MDLESIILSELNQTKKEKYLGNLERNDANEHIYKIETDLQTQKMNLWLQRSGGGMTGRRDSQGVRNGHVHTALLKMNNQQGPTVQHKELCSMLHRSLEKRRWFGGEWKHVWGFPGGSDGKESACNAGDLGFDPWVGKIPWRRAWQPTQIFLPGESP